MTRLHSSLSFSRPAHPIARAARRRSLAAPAAAVLTAAMAAALLLPLPSPARAADPPTAAREKSTASEYDRCLAMTRNEPSAALTKAEAWRNAGGGFPADHCAAVALIKLRRYAEAAQRLEAMAGAMMKSDPALRADALEQAGQAWLLADHPAEAKAAFDAALTYKHDDPDLLIDRAQTFAEAGQFWDAIDDLNRAIELAPNRADAHIFRASAYRRLPDGLDLAQQDIDIALKIAPEAATAYLERGNIRALKGDMAGAKADWQHVEKLAPRTADAVAAHNNIAHLIEQADKSAATPDHR
jgi:tetratricopeptide (TPR) repeat protein